jgi:hypothetical protein
MVPAAPEPAVIERLNKEIVAILAMPETADRFASLGIEAWRSTPQQMQSIIQTDIQKWGKVIREAHIEAERDLARKSLLDLMVNERLACATVFGHIAAFLPSVQPRCRVGLGSFPCPP